MRIIACSVLHVHQRPFLVIDNDYPRSELDSWLRQRQHGLAIRVGSKPSINASTLTRCGWSGIPFNCGFNDGLVGSALATVLHRGGRGDGPRCHAVPRIDCLSDRGVVQASESPHPVQYLAAMATSVFASVLSVRDRNASPITRFVSTDRHASTFCANIIIAGF